MPRRWLVLLVLGLTVLVGAAMVGSSVSSSQPRPVRQPGPLLVVGMPTLRWRDVSPTRTPNLWAMAARGAVGSQATRDTVTPSCSEQSWLTLSAGTDATVRSAFPTAPGKPRAMRCPPPLVVTSRADGSATFPQWSLLRRREGLLDNPADLGRAPTLLADELGECVAGAGVHAPVAAADRTGTVAYYSASADAVDLSVCPVTFIGLAKPDDAFLGRLLHRAPAGSTIVVSGIADDTGPVTLHPVVMTGPGIAHGSLTSLSTRQPGLLQTTDLSALVLARLQDRAPLLDAGRRPHVITSADRHAPVTAAAGLARALDVEHSFVPWFFALYLGGVAVGLGAGILGWWLSRRRVTTPRFSRRVRLVFAVVGAMTASTPMATMLVGTLPWWRASHPTAALALGVLVIAAASAALALRGPWRGWAGGPVAFVAAVTLAVISLDVIEGSGLQLISLMGLQPVYGGRFFGQGNVAFAVYATSALVLAAIMAGLAREAGSAQLAVLIVACLGAGTVVIDASPLWGADGGGTISLVPPFVYLALASAGLSLTWRRATITAAATLGLAAAVAIGDSLGPPRYRTHLGDAVTRIWSTGRLTDVQHIWTENGSMLTSSWLNLSVVLVVAVVGVALLRPRVLGSRVRDLVSTVPFLGRGLTALGACLLLGFAFNDSGTVIPPTGLLVVLPLLVLLAAGTRRASTQGP